MNNTQAKVNSEEFKKAVKFICNFYCVSPDTAEDYYKDEINAFLKIQKIQKSESQNIKKVEL